MNKHQHKAFLVLRLMIYISFFLSQAIQLSPEVILIILVNLCLIYDFWDSYQNWRKLK